MKQLLKIILLMAVLLGAYDFNTLSGANDYFAAGENVQNERTERLNAYLAEHSAMVELVERLEADYYADLTAWDFTLAEMFEDNDSYAYLAELYQNNRLDAAKSIPVYYFPFMRYEQGGNTFLELLARLENSPFAENLPAIDMYEIAIVNENGQCVGTAKCPAAKDAAGRQADVFPWNGDRIETYTLKLSAPLLQALLETPLHLDETHVRLVSFGGHYGAVFFDSRAAYFTPIMGEGGISDCELYVDKLYTVAEAVKVFERVFEGGDL